MIIRHILLGLAAALMLGSCAQKSMELTPGIPQFAVQSCAQSGGSLEQRGRRGNLMCVHSYGDAGKSCSTKKDCQGRCLAERADGGLPKVGEAAPGRCQPDDRLFGCFAELEGGKVKSAMCID